MYCQLVKQFNSLIYFMEVSIHCMLKTIVMHTLSMQIPGGRHMHVLLLPHFHEASNEPMTGGDVEVRFVFKLLRITPTDK